LNQPHKICNELNYGLSSLQLQSSSVKSGQVEKKRSSGINPFQ